MCMNSGALFPSSINGWVNKRTFTVGLQNVSPHSEMPDVLSGVSRPHATELHNLSDYTRLYPMLSRCQIPWFLPPPLARLYKHFWKISPETTMPECHANLLLTETPCQLLEKATLARIMFNCLTKILLILDWCSAYLTVLTERELCTITCPWQTDTYCTFYWTHYLQL